MEYPILQDEEENVPLILKRCAYYEDIQLWSPHRLDPRGWLNNFLTEELPYAYDLLKAFLYYNEVLSTELLTSAFSRLTPYVTDVTSSASKINDDWRNFVERAVVTLVTGETPNPSDSGFGFVRRARDVFGLEENQLRTPDIALQEIYKDFLEKRPQRPIVFTDDFVGSGNQFIETWERQYEVGKGTTLSFSKIAEQLGGFFAYCPLLCTVSGARAIRRKCPAVRLSPAHILTEAYNALDPSSTIFAPERRATAENVLYQIALRSGMPDTNGSDVNDWRGFSSLGLCVAVEDSIPDACLGVFRWNGPGWTPLFKKH